LTDERWPAPNEDRYWIAQEALLKNCLDYVPGKPAGLRRWMAGQPGEREVFLRHEWRRAPEMGERRERKRAYEEARKERKTEVRRVRLKTLAKAAAEGRGKKRKECF
jgi:hypothetical protein